MDKIRLGGFPNIRPINKEELKISSFKKKIVLDKNLLKISDILKKKI